jgi:Ca2+-binding EF-hand superfamily protein
MLDLHGSFERASLRKALRLACNTDTIQLEQLKSLLTTKGIGLSEAATSNIAEQIFNAHGASITIEELVTFLVPVRRAPDFDELNDSEVAFLRTSFDAIAGGEGSVTADKLDAAAAQMHGLHEGTLSADDKADITERISALCFSLGLKDGRAELSMLFNVFREHQREKRSPPTQQQLIRAFSAFDGERSGTLPLEKVREVLKLFDGVVVNKLLADCKVGDEGSSKKSITRIDYRKLIDSYLDHLSRMPEEVEQEEEDADRKKRGFLDGISFGLPEGWFGGMFGQKGKPSEKGSDAPDPAPAPTATGAGAPAGPMVLATPIKINRGS